MNAIEPIVLKRTLTPAARFAEVLPPIEANTAVIVVPILLPNTNGKAAVSVIAPES